jgi:hypothetical protein
VPIPRAGINRIHPPPPIHPPNRSTDGENEANEQQSEAAVEPSAGRRPDRPDQAWTGPDGLDGLDGLDRRDGMDGLDGMGRCG